jgi:glycosyltransferase involved in cell wall biosynthesis
VWAVGASYPLGYYQHPVLLSRRLVEKLKGYERVSSLMEEGTLLDEASNHSRYVLKAPGIPYHARARGLRNEKPPEPVHNVLMNENLVMKNGVIQIDTLARQRSEPRVPLKILWIIDSLDRDDGEMVWFHYLRYLSAESRHRFRVVTLKDGPMRQTYEKICPVHIASENQQKLSECISALHAQANFDVAFVSSVENFWFPDILMRLQVPTLWQLYPGRQTEEARLSEELRQRFLYPATILFLNSEIARTYRHFDTRNVSRILPTGVDLAGMKTFKQQNSPFDWRAKFGIKQSSAVFLIAGPTIERKGQHTFVKAALEVLARNPEREIDWIIAGTRPGIYYDEMMQLLELSGRMERFHIFPETDDPFQYYPHYLIADVCVSCSLKETFPLTTLEAMAMKKAVVATQVFSTNEVVEHEGNGFLATPDDPGELAEHLDFLVKKPEFRDFFGRRSLEIIYEKFQFRKVVTRLEDLLRESIVCNAG